jgi:hypothetical protein
MPSFALSRRQRGFEYPLGIKDQNPSDKPNARVLVGNVGTASVEGAAGERAPSPQRNNAVPHSTARCPSPGCVQTVARAADSAPPPNSAPPTGCAGTTQR